ncbi:hypothetical protein D9619_006267 [Psilocybe cf. subviscida]|uniref:Mitotic-spindle organizing protein 1 n=1 Tax=Psilocybe cf. subviscida TaxID=2480587 RepID=A0A8H5EY74_9AGAR|nr:hypothetical protein D9619_006267 [Psilocybe cf. subviscida]
MIVGQDRKKSVGSLDSMSTKENDRNSSAQETLNILYEISQLLNTQLDKATLATCVGMIENGVNPEALAVRVVVLSLVMAVPALRCTELRREGATLSGQPGVLGTNSR